LRTKETQVIAMKTMNIDEYDKWYFNCFIMKV